MNTIGYIISEIKLRVMSMFTGSYTYDELKNANELSERIKDQGEVPYTLNEYYKSITDKITVEDNKEKSEKNGLSDSGIYAWVPENITDFIVPIDKFNKMTLKKQTKCSLMLMFTRKSIKYIIYLRKKEIVKMYEEIIKEIPEFPYTYKVFEHKGIFGIVFTLNKENPYKQIKDDNEKCNIISIANLQMCYNAIARGDKSITLIASEYNSLIHNLGFKTEPSWFGLFIKVYFKN